MSWGIRIVILYVAFIGMIGTMVALTMREKVDLVADDYYQQELQYQDKLDQMNQSMQYSSAPVVSLSDGKMDVVFPEELNGKEIRGNAYFYRASDSKGDQREDFTTSEGRISLSTTGLMKGIYTLKLTWEAEGKSMYNEQIVTIP